MAIGFKNILVPVDFSASTDIAIEKAIEFSDGCDAVVHLLHVITPLAPWTLFFTGIHHDNNGPSASEQSLFLEANRKLDQCKSAIEAASPGIKVKTRLSKEVSVQHAIIRLANRLSPDLIIIGKQNDQRHFLFFNTVSPDHVAKSTHCPVLTIKPGSGHRAIKNIVIPIRDFVPERKLELATRIAKKYNSKVHLVSMSGYVKNGNDAASQAFFSSYCRLREDLHHPAEYGAIDKHNLVKAILSYTEFIKADLILVNPEIESGINSLAGSRHISDFLKRDSKIQILDVQPYL